MTPGESRSLSTRQNARAGLPRTTQRLLKIWSCRGFYSRASVRWHWRTTLVTRSRLAPQHALEIHQVAERLGGIRVTARQADVPRAEAVGHRVAVLPEPHALLRKREKHLAPEQEE